jgi:hypothetical protein
VAFEVPVSAICPSVSDGAAGGADVVAGGDVGAAVVPSVGEGVEVGAVALGVGFAVVGFGVGLVAVRWIRKVSLPWATPAQPEPTLLSPRRPIDVPDRPLVTVAPIDSHRASHRSAGDLTRPVRLRRPRGLVTERPTEDVSECAEHPHVTTSGQPPPDFAISVTCPLGRA